MFVQKYWEKEFFLWAQLFDRRCVCNLIEQCGKNLSLMKCWGYENKLHYHKQYVVQILRLSGLNWKRNMNCPAAAAALI